MRRWLLDHHPGYVLVIVLALMAAETSIEWLLFEHKRAPTEGRP